ncbi:MAG: phosphodiester glycosidase family protein [Rhizobiaceae bacterium]|nr:phosphodiester glycosidase family protein [Rhizobiaceae bacterium]
MARILISLMVLIAGTLFGQAQSGSVPPATGSVVQSLNQASWSELEEGLSLLRSRTPEGLIVTAYRISPRRFEFSIVTQLENTGSRAREIGEQTGAVLVTNAGFFAINGNNRLYSIGYLRLQDRVLSKGWSDAGGTITFLPDGPVLKPTHEGIPQNQHDVLQSRPMIVEPGANWAMGSNSGARKLRTVLCTLANGDVILTTISRVGLTLFEAGWLFRSVSEGGFFGCDAAIALDGGGSTQLWHSGYPQYSFLGISPVHNFLVVRQREAP